MHSNTYFLGINIIQRQILNIHVNKYSASGVIKTMWAHAGYTVSTKFCFCVSLHSFIRCSYLGWLLWKAQWYNINSHNNAARSRPLKRTVAYLYGASHRVRGERAANRAAVVCSILYSAKADWNLHHLLCAFQKSWFLARHI